MRQSPQEQLLEGGFAFRPSKANCGKGQNTILSGILQSTFHCIRNKPKMATNFGPQCIELVSQGQNFQSGNTRVDCPFNKEGGSLRWTSATPTFTSLSVQTQGS